MYLDEMVAATAGPYIERSNSTSEIDFATDVFAVDVHDHGIHLWVEAKNVVVTSLDGTVLECGHQRREGLRKRLLSRIKAWRRSTWRRPGGTPTAQASISECPLKVLVSVGPGSHHHE
jgi:hypothetical protein